MLSTVLELAGFAALVTSATLFGLLVGVLVAVACGLVALGVVLVVVGLAAAPSGRRVKR